MVIQILISIFVFCFLLVMYSLMKMASISDESIEDYKINTGEPQDINETEKI